MSKERKWAKTQSHASMLNDIKLYTDIFKNKKIICKHFVNHVLTNNADNILIISGEIDLFNFELAFDHWYSKERRI